MYNLEALDNLPKKQKMRQTIGKLKNNRHKFGHQCNFFNDFWDRRYTHLIRFKYINTIIEKNVNKSFNDLFSKISKKLNWAEKDRFLREFEGLNSYYNVVNDKIEINKNSFYFRFYDVIKSSNIFPKKNQTNKNKRRKLKKIKKRKEYELSKELLKKHNLKSCNKNNRVIRKLKKTLDIINYITNKTDTDVSEKIIQIEKIIYNLKKDKKIITFEDYYDRYCDDFKSNDEKYYSGYGLKYTINNDNSKAWKRYNPLIYLNTTKGKYNYLQVFDPINDQAVIKYKIFDILHELYRQSKI